MTLEVGKVIQRGRQSNGLTQKDLATVRLCSCGVGTGDRCLDSIGKVGSLHSFGTLP